MPTINVANAKDDKQENVAPVNANIKAEKENVEATETLRERKEREAKEPYFDERFVTISLIGSSSLYRKANDKVLNERNEYIGSCVRSSRTLSANKDEVIAYFPNLIGVSPTNENFVRRVKEYLNNIQVKVDKLGKRLNISFHYNHLEDYLRLKKKEEAIDAEFGAVNRGDSKALNAAIERKIVQINALESEKYKYGYPDNIEDYLLYRHCMLYSDVAKDIAIVNSKPNIRFYFRDEQKEKEIESKRRIEINNAKRNYVNLVGNNALFDDVYAVYCVQYNKPLIPSLAEDRIIKEADLDYFSSHEPVRFNKICSDKDVTIKATIEKLIAYGVFNRHPNSQNIITASGDFIGANMKEAVAWFKDPTNESIRSSFENQLKFM